MHELNREPANKLKTHIYATCNPLSGVATAMVNFLLLPMANLSEPFLVKQLSFCSLRTCIDSVMMQ